MHRRCDGLHNRWRLFGSRRSCREGDSRDQSRDLQGTAEDDTQEINAEHKTSLDKTVPCHGFSPFGSDVR